MSHNSEIEDISPGPAPPEFTLIEKQFIYAKSFHCLITEMHLLASQ